MKKIKRFMAVAAAALTMMTGLTACTGSDDSASADTQLNRKSISSPKKCPKLSKNSGS